MLIIHGTSMAENDEVRMTNDEKGQARRAISFGLRHSFELRHSSFLRAIALAW
jgi:hypothetical protein